MSDLFFNEAKPLAHRMRARNLNEFVGQSHILSQGSLLRRSIEIDRLSSLILYGPPGSGKTTLAKVIAATTKRRFSAINSVLTGVKNLREEIDKASESLKYFNQQTILFIDEVHHFNKSQQDALLPHVESGLIIFIGATTENPYFEVNKALISRSLVFQLKSLDKESMKKIALNALHDKERGFGNLNIDFHPLALDHIINIASGDARKLLNAIEISVLTTKEKDGKIEISLEIAEQSIQERAPLYDKDGDFHYDIISAFIKSIRGSDPDAALYWLARMIKSGERPRAIFRRLLISAAEDIGLSDPNAVVVVNSCASAFETIGMPEGQFHLSLATIYLATTTKSNTTMSYFDALDKVEKSFNDEVPIHLKDSSRTKESLGHGQNYLYPHAYEDHFIAQKYMPKALDHLSFYTPSNQGYEKKIKDRHFLHKLAQMEVNYNDSYITKREKDREIYLNKALNTSSAMMIEILDELYKNHNYDENHTTLFINAKTGFFLSKAWIQSPLGHTIAIVKREKEKEDIDNLFKNQNILERVQTSLNYPKDYTFDHIFLQNGFKTIDELKEKLTYIKSNCKRTSVFSLLYQDQEKTKFLDKYLAKKDFVLKDDLIKILKENFKIIDEKSFDLEKEIYLSQNRYQNLIENFNLTFDKDKLGKSFSYFYTLNIIDLVLL